MMEFVLKYIAEIVIGVIISILATIILFWWGKRKSFHPFKYHKAKKHVKEAGIVTFYYNRRILQADAGTIGDYVKKAKTEVYYVGCWLSSSLNSLDLSNAILEKAQQGIKFHFCVISPNSILINKYSEFFDESYNDLISKLNSTLNMLTRIKEDLPGSLRNNVKIYIHDKIITASFWAIDPSDKKNALFQLDHKIFKSTRFNSYGMEIKYSDKSEFASEIKKGYFAVFNEAKEVKEEKEEE